MPTNRSSCESSTNDCTLVGRKSRPGGTRAPAGTSAGAKHPASPYPRSRRSPTRARPPRAPRRAGRLRRKTTPRSRGSRRHGKPSFRRRTKRSLVAILAPATSSVHPSLAHDRRPRQAPTLASRARIAPTGPLEPGQPFVVAHRAGNDLGGAPRRRGCRRAGRRGRRLPPPRPARGEAPQDGGPLPLLWDRWRARARSGRACSSRRCCGRCRPRPRSSST